MEYFAGVDTGSLSTEVVIVDQDLNILAYSIQQTGSDPIAASQAAMADALEPLLALEAGRGDFSLRLVLGPSLELFLDDDQQLEGDAAEVVLLYSLEATARVAEALQLFAGVRGLSMLSTSPLLSTLMLSFGGAVRLDKFSPFIRITVPVQGFFPSAVVLACGAGAQF